VEPGTGRPEWATDEPHGPQPQVRGAQAHRVPGKDLPLTHIAPPMVGRAAEPAAGDGMDPGDDLLLRETQRLLSTSLTFAGGPDEVAGRFWAALQQADPGVLDALPGGARSQTGQFAQALTWLVHHLDQPPALVAGCARLGSALAACGVDLSEPHFVGPALAEAMRAGMPAGAWRQDFDLAWRSTWQHAYEWIRHGATSGAPMFWDAVVVQHELRRDDLAVIRLRPVLPMPFRAGQYARIELPSLPAIWRPYSLAGAPRRDDLVELHVRAKTENGVSGTLVYRTAVGDPVRISPAEGRMTLPDNAERDLLMIAGDTGVAPLKALLTELADTGDPRSAVLFWGVRDLSELYDIAEITDLARLARRATVVPVVAEGSAGPYASGLVTDAVAAYGEWSGHEVFLAGPPAMLAATTTALHALGVAPDRIHHDTPE
jgi:NAD(P)H-flavin reductase